MRLLLDTSILIWMSDPDAFDAGRLDTATRTLLSDRRNEVAFSVVGIWEIAIKFALRRPTFGFDPQELRQGLLDAGFDELPVAGEHAVAVRDLPSIHRDPFDRMLVAQAQVEGMTLLTADAVLARYPVSVRLV